jgi:hypothetical protein
MLRAAEAALDGHVTVVLAGAATPAASDTFTPVVADTSLAGHFATSTLPLAILPDFGLDYGQRAALYRTHVGDTPPSLDPIPDVTVAPGEDRILTLSASDAELDTFRWEIVPGAPDWIRIDGWPPAGVELHVYPPWGIPSGDHTVSIRVVADVRVPALSDTETFVVHVVGANIPPHFAPIADMTVLEGQPIIVQAQAGDDPAQTLAFSIVSAPGGSAINGATGQFTIPAGLPAGSYPITLRVTDDAGPPLHDDATFVVTVDNVAPVVSVPGGNLAVIAGAPWNRAGLVTDRTTGPRTGTVTYGDGASGPLTLNPDGSFALAHAYAAPGSYAVVVQVADALGATGTHQFTVTASAPPVLKLSNPFKGGAQLARSVAIDFAAALNRQRVFRPDNYDLREAGRDRKFFTADDVKVRIKRIVPDFVLRRIKLVTRQPLAAERSYLLVAKATNRRTGLTDARGRLIDGNNDGKPGGDARLFFGKPAISRR